MLSKDVAQDAFIKWWTTEARDFAAVNEHNIRNQKL